MFVIRDCGAHLRIQASETHAEMTETTSDPNELCRTNCAGPEQAPSTKHQKHLSRPHAAADAKNKRVRACLAFTPRPAPITCTQQRANQVSCRVDDLDCSSDNTAFVLLYVIVC